MEELKMLIMFTLASLLLHGATRKKHRKSTKKK
jgi:hypothetical protein